MKLILLNIEYQRAIFCYLKYKLSKITQQLPLNSRNSEINKMDIIFIYNKPMQSSKKWIVSAQYKGKSISCKNFLWSLKVIKENKNYSHLHVKDMNPNHWIFPWANE